MGERGWLTTFVDMLLLIFTFLVFIIAVSRFKNSGEIWFPLPQESMNPGKDTPKKEPKGTAIELIRGLKIPRMPKAAERILSEMAMASQAGTYEGVNLFYNENKISVLFPDKLTFLPSSSELDKTALDVLRDLAERLANSSYPVSIEGHTDNSVGGKTDNIELSVERALAVARQLMAFGLPLKRISVSGYGPYRPIADNSSSESRLLNRRVEVHIMVNEDLF